MRAGVVSSSTLFMAVLCTSTCRLWRVPCGFSAGARQPTLDIFVSEIRQSRALRKNQFLIDDRVIIMF